MTKKIFIVLGTLILLFIGGGFYVTQSMDGVVVRLEKIIGLHQVELFRKTLLTRVNKVQEDLLLKDSPHAVEVDSFIVHAEQMEESIDLCFSCHHIETTQKQLEELRKEIGDYQTALSRVYTVRANRERIFRERQSAFAIGQHVVESINKIIIISSDILSERTLTARNKIAATKKHLILFVIFGPLIALTIVAYFIKHFTGSLAVLIKATRKLKAGDLEHKISGLQDEFGELAESFNDMGSALKEMIYNIEENQKRYRMLFESAGDAIFLLEAEGEAVGKIVSANRAAAEMHGFTVEELMEMKIQDLDTPEAVAESPGRIQRMLDGEWIKAELTHRKKDGTIFPVEISAGLLEFGNNKYFLAFDRDITERKQAQEALQRANQLVKVGEMAAGLAHEIKNPLAGIKVSIEVLASELELGQKDKDVFSLIINEINRIEILLKNLLSYARPPKPNFISLDVNEILETAIKTVQLSWAGTAEKTGSVKDIQFIKELSVGLPSIVADGAQLQQVVLNLLLNAVDAIQEKGAITVKSLTKGEDAVQIVIADTGKGIDARDFEKIFQPFFTTKPKGTGLGLSICKRLIDQHYGRIRVAPNLDGGLVFTICLPRVQKNEDCSP
jgi:two-component system sensor histidine kinase AtoS